MNKVLARFDETSRRSADVLLKETMKNMFGSIIEQTPVGDFDPDHAGLLKANWILTEGAPSDKQVEARQPKRTRSSLKFPKRAFGRVFYLTNNLPYVNVVEFGGYPQEVVRGTWNKVKRKWQIRSAKGFSRQAPKGMVRKNLDKLGRFLNAAANKSFGRKK